MRQAFPSPGRLRPLALWQRVVARGAIGLVMALNFLAATPQAHAWLHADAEEARSGPAGCAHAAADSSPLGAASDDAGCVVTQFANGQVGGELATFVFSAASCAQGNLPQPATPLVGSTDIQLPPGCGPPRA